MKLCASLLLSVLASAAFGLPSIRDDDGEPLPQTSRVTAFVIDKRGNPSVECWELSNMVNDMTVQRKDGTRGTAYSMTMATSSELDGLEILTWPPNSPIWPDPEMYASGDGVRPQWLDFAGSFNLFNVQSGLINFEFRGGMGLTTTAADLPDHTFSQQNGDDWYYFEDQYTGSDEEMRADAPPPPVFMTTVSASETEVIRLRFKKRPSYRVMHKGGCSFTGVSTPMMDDRSTHASRTHHLLKQAAEL